MPVKRKVPTWILGLVGGLALLRAVLLFWRFDRLPPIPALGDEVFLNEAALSWATSGKLICAGMPHSPLGFDQVFGHHPPLFFLIQGVVFRLLGFEALSLRLVGLVCSALAPIVCVAIMRRLWKEGILTGRAVLLTSFLMFLDATTLAHARWARMEALCVVFTAVAIYAVVQAGGQAKRSTKVALFAGCALGLALATHASAVLALPFFALLVFMRVKTNPARLLAWVSCLVLPVIIWVAVHGEQSVAALRQMRAAYSYLPPPLLWDLWPRATAIRSAGVEALRSFNQVGGTVLGLYLLAIALTCWRAMFDTSATNARYVLACCGATLCPLPVLLFFMAASGTRFLQLFPVIVVSIAVGLSYATSRRFMRAASVVACGAVLMQAVSLCMYFRRGPGQDPRRYDAMVESVQAHERVLASPALWFAFNAHAQRIDLIYPFPDSETTWLTPEHMDVYDVILVQRGTSNAERIMASAASVLPRRTEQCVGGDCFVEFRRR